MRTRREKAAIAWWSPSCSTPEEVNINRAIGNDLSLQINNNFCIKKTSLHSLQPLLPHLVEELPCGAGVVEEKATQLG